MRQPSEEDHATSTATTGESHPFHPRLPPTPRTLFSEAEILTLHTRAAPVLLPTSTAFSRKGAAHLTRTFFSRTRFSQSSFCLCLCLLLSQTAKNTGVHLQQPKSEAQEADDRCSQVSLARRLVLAHPAASDPANISATCPNVSAAKRVCSCPRQLQCIVCKSGGGGDQPIWSLHTRAPRLTSRKPSQASHESPSPTRNPKGLVRVALSSCEAEAYAMNKGQQTWACRSTLCFKQTQVRRWVS